MTILRLIWKNFNEGLAAFGKNINSVVTTALLLVVYFLGVGLTSIIAKLFKKTFLDLSLRPKSETYWDQLNLKKKEIESYLRQF